MFTLEKLSLVKRNVHILEVKNEKIQFKIGNEKYPSWKLVMRKPKIGNWKCEIGNGHGPSGPP